MSGLSPEERSKSDEGCVHHGGYRLVEAEEIDCFLALLDLNWDFLFRRSLFLVEGKRQAVLRKPQSMPLEHNIKLLKDFTVTSMADIVDSNNGTFDIDMFNKLRALAVSRQIVFNVRRGGEPSRITVTEWEDAKDRAWVDPQHAEAITDPIEKYLINSYKLAYHKVKEAGSLLRY